MNKINKMNKVNFEPPIVTQNNIDIYTSFIDLKEENLYISKIMEVVKQGFLYSPTETSPSAQQQTQGLGSM